VKSLGEAAEVAQDTRAAQYILREALRPRTSWSNSLASQAHVWSAKLHADARQAEKALARLTKVL
jgi:hypothetical protein